MMIKTNISNFRQLLMVVVFTTLVSACSSDDDAATSGVDPDNCSTPCIQTTPDLDITMVTAADGATITMILAIDGDASLIDLSSSFTTLEPVDTSNGQGKLATATNGVVDTVANTFTMNFVIPSSSITGSFYPKLVIGVADTPDPNDPSRDAPNWAVYELDADNSLTTYSYSEVVGGESSTFTSNGIFVGTEATDIVIPLITLQ